MTNKAGELARTVALCELFGTGILKHGTVKTDAIRIGDSIMFSVIIGNGETYSTNLRNVPIELWPAEIIERVKEPPSISGLPLRYHLHYKLRAI